MAFGARDLKVTETTLYDNKGEQTENTPYGKISRTVRVLFTKKILHDYPKAGTDTPVLDKKVYWNSQLVGGFQMGNAADIAKIATQFGFTF